jgi:hypothetical protein
MSIRWDFQTALVAALQAEITTGNGYEHDLSSQGDITNDVATLDQRRSSMPSDAQVQVEEGREDHTMPEVSPDTHRHAIFEVPLSCLVRGQTTTALWRKRLNDLVANISLALHKDQSVGGVVDRARVARVDEPTYDPDYGVAHVIVRLVVEYQYQAGVSI